MIIVCRCGQKSRVRDLALINQMRCAGCKAMLAGEANRQATRNAKIVLDIAAVLALKEKQGRITGEEELLANIIVRHEEGR